MDVVVALRKFSGVARMRDLTILGISREEIWGAIRSEKILRVRKGWIALPTISPLEFHAISARGLLTCASAASVFGFPVKESHLHLRGRNSFVGGSRTTRRKPPSRIGACVGLVDMVIDYANCQDPEWLLALVDYLERNGKLARPDWNEVEMSVPKSVASVVEMRSRESESVLESIVRYRLTRAKIPHEIQVSIGRFRADFVISHGIVLETHGAEFHSELADWERDRRKVTSLRSQGWDVLEVSYSQVMNEWDSVLSAIVAARSRQRKRQIPDFLVTKTV